jgi:hypothetical protein
MPFFGSYPEPFTVIGVWPAEATMSVETVSLGFLPFSVWARAAVPGIIVVIIAATPATTSTRFIPSSPLT